MAQDSDTFDKTSWTLWAVGTGSGVWLLVAAILFAIAEPCSKSAAGFWAARVACLPPNEMGDFLAGVFAPLAFLWLIAAVFLQKSELAAQRQELKETREVAEKNIAFIEEQTKLLADQRKQAKQDSVDHQIDELVLQIGSLFSELSKKPLARWRIDENRGTSLMPITESASDPLTHYISDSIRSFDRGVEGYFKSQGAPTSRSFTKQLNAIVAAMDEIEKIVENASQSKRFQIANIDFERMRKALRVFMGEQSSS